MYLLTSACICHIVSITLQIISLDEMCVQFSLPTFNCIEILKHLVKRGDIFGVFVSDGEQFVCVDESTTHRVASFANQQGSLLMTDLSKLVQ